MLHADTPFEIQESRFRERRDAAWLEGQFRAISVKMLQNGHFVAFIVPPIAPF